MKKEVKPLPSVYLMYFKKEPVLRSALASPGFSFEALISLFRVRFRPDIGLQLCPTQRGMKQGRKVMLKIFLA
jgi:hypothetical protein